MSAAETVQALELAGVTLAVDPEGKIRMQVPASVHEAVSPLLADIRAHRDEALDHLRHRDEPSPGPCVVCLTHTANLYCFSCWRERLARRPRRPA